MVIYTQQDYLNSKKHPFKKIGFISLGVIWVATMLSTASWFLYIRHIPQNMAVNSVQSLISEGTFESIEAYVADGFLGSANEEEFNNAAGQLTSLKNYEVTVNSLVDIEGGKIALLTLKPKDVNVHGYSSYMAVVKLQENNLLSYKVSAISTDYGRESFAAESE